MTMKELLVAVLIYTECQLVFVSFRKYCIVSIVSSVSIVNSVSTELFLVLRPGQTLATFQRNILQHCVKQEENCVAQSLEIN